MDEDRLDKLLDIGGLKTEKQKSHGKKIAESVFDHQSLMSLYALSKKGYFNQLKSVVSAGKEAVLFHAEGDVGEVAVKIYMVETSDFKNMTRYIRGDPRFSNWRNRRQLVYLWAQKEYKNLSKMHEKIPCPKPYAVIKNVLVMSFIGKDGVAAPKMKEDGSGNAKKQFKTVVKSMREMYSQRLVHADLSEYNILNDKGKPVLIDFSTSVLLDHPQAQEFLERDIGNIVRYFGHRKVETDFQKVLAEVTDGK